MCAWLGPGAIGIRWGSDGRVEMIGIGGMETVDRKRKRNSPLDQRRKVIHVVSHAGKARWCVCTKGKTVRTANPMLGEGATAASCSSCDALEAGIKIIC